MNQKFFFLCAVICFFGIANAQKKYEVSASYGLPSLYGTFYSFLDAVFNSVDQNEEVRVSARGIAEVSFGIYSPNGKWKYGAAIVNEFFDDQNANVTTDANFFTILPNVNYMWRRPERKFQIYSGAGIGISYLEYHYSIRRPHEVKKDKTTIVTWNILPLGFRYGKDYGVLSDFSVGIKSFGRFGFFYRF